LAVEFVDNAPLQSEKKIRGRDFLKEIIGFAVLFGIVIVVGAIIFLALNLSDFYHNFSTFMVNIEFWFYLLFYAGFFCTFMLWAKGIKKQNLKSFFLSCPHLPEKGHRWFYVAYTTVWSGIIIVLIVLIAEGIVFLATINAQIILLLIYGCVEAPIVEEIIFRGYIYSRAEAVWGRRRFFAAWSQQEKSPQTQVVQTKRVMGFEITFPALVSSIFFGIYHIPSYGVGAVVQFIGGLIFCKARNEWGNTLIAPMLLHSSWNLLAGAFQLGLLTYQPTQANIELLFYLEVILLVGIVLILGFVFLVNYLGVKRVKWLDQLHQIIISEKIRPHVRELVEDGGINAQQAAQVETFANELVELAGSFIEQATPKSLLLYYISSMERDSPELLELTQSLFGKQFSTKDALDKLWNNTPQDQIDAAVKFWGEERDNRRMELMRILGAINEICDSAEILRQLKDSFSIKNVAGDLPGVLDLMTGTEAFDNLISYSDIVKKIEGEEQVSE